MRCSGVGVPGTGWPGQSSASGARYLLRSLADTCTLRCYSLLVPATAKKINVMFADVLNSPTGRVAQLYLIVRMLRRVDDGDSPALSRLAGIFSYLRPLRPSEVREQRGDLCHAGGQGGLASPLSGARHARCGNHLRKGVVQPWNGFLNRA